MSSCTHVLLSLNYMYILVLVYIHSTCWRHFVHLIFGETVWPVKEFQLCPLLACYLGPDTSHQHISSLSCKPETDDSWVPPSRACDENLMDSAYWNLLKLGKYWEMGWLCREKEKPTPEFYNWHLCNRHCFSPELKRWPQGVADPWSFK